MILKMVIQGLQFIQQSLLWTVIRILALQELDKSRKYFRSPGAYQKKKKTLSNSNLIPRKSRLKKFQSYYFLLFSPQENPNNNNNNNNDNNSRDRK